eukprot:COSAG02_NODE_68965_length_209_cov_110.781818_1_plen_44_part_10
MGRTVAEVSHHTISKLRCVSSWKMFELLRMQCVHCCRDSQQRVA